MSKNVYDSVFIKDNDTAADVGIIMPLSFTQGNQVEILGLYNMTKKDYAGRYNTLFVVIKCTDSNGDGMGDQTGVTPITFITLSFPKNQIRDVGSKTKKLKIKKNHKIRIIVFHDNEFEPGPGQEDDFLVCVSAKIPTVKHDISADISDLVEKCLPQFGPQKSGNSILIGE